MAKPSPSKQGVLGMLTAAQGGVLRDGCVWVKRDNVNCIYHLLAEARQR